MLPNPPSMMNNKPSFMEKILVGWLPAFLCAAVIFYLSSRPSSTLPKAWFPHMDKFVHAGEYGLLAVLLFRAMTWPQYTGFRKERLLRLSLWIMAIASLYALSDEIHQIFVPGRSAGFGDWVADVTGALLAIAILLRLAWPPQKAIQTS
jgi:VanZ family protein